MKKVLIMNRYHRNRLLFGGALVITQILTSTSAGLAQSLVASTEVVTEARTTTKAISTGAKYSDPQTGMTAEQAVAYALEHNGELQAARKEMEAARALVKQASLRANPRVDASVAKTIRGMDNT